MKLINDDSLYLSEEEFSKYSKRLIGEGKDAKVYAYSNEFLLKIYKECTSIISFEKFDTANGVLKAYSPSIIREAIVRQKFIKNTSLPLAIVYVDGIFKGSLIRRHRCSFELHKVWGLLSHKKRCLVLRRLLNNVKELNDNFIYHFDLTNRPDGVGSDDYSHSNILISRGFDVNIIDLDGRSTIYTDKRDLSYESIVYSSLLSLIIELITDYDIPNDMTPEDKRFYERELLKHGFSDKIISSLVGEEGRYVEVDSLISLYEEKKLLLK